MAVSEGSRGLYIDKIKAEYGKNYDLVKWISSDEILFFTRQRDELLKNSFSGFGSDACETKYFSNRLSPGCRICMEGTWSCLFITGLCNGNCFYCPASQNEDIPPVSQNIEFNTPKDYADYIEKAGFKGASISGGEPLLKFEACVSYIKELRNRFGHDFHIWLYTNGILGTSDKFKALREAGLSEIRFDIGANAYSLESLKKASDYFDCLTVEIPAVPDDKELLMSKLPQLQKAGVKYLNLHQLRLTPYNFERVIKRGYTYSHGVKAVCVESEIAALEIINYTLEKNIDLGVNYCSFAYKNRFQSAAFRHRGAMLIKQNYDDVTKSGYLRRVSVSGTEAFLKEKSLILKNTVGEKGWAIKNNKLFFKFNLLPLIRTGSCSINIEYLEPRMVPFISYYNYFKDIHINDNKKISVEEVRLFQKKGVGISDEIISMDIPVHEKILLCDLNSAERADILKYELIEANLPEYY